MLLHRVVTLTKKPNQGGIGMVDVTSTVQNAASGVVGVKSTYCTVCLCKHYLFHGF